MMNEELKKEIEMYIEKFMNKHWYRFFDLNDVISNLFYFTSYIAFVLGLIIGFKFLIIYL